MEPTQTYTLEVCSDGLGIMSGPADDHTVVRVESGDAGLSVQPVIQVGSLTDAWYALFMQRYEDGTTSTPRLPG